MRAASLLDQPGSALDLGAGAGRDTAYLLQQGWQVTAVDASPSAIAALKTMGHANLQVVPSRMQDFDPGTYDLINAQFSLPFVPRDQHGGTIARLQSALRHGGVMAVTFFGPRDEWNTEGTQLTFHTEAEIRALFDGWEILELEETDEDGQTADGNPKHWHSFQLIARRP
jgi:trans-aconitate methyltransferase